MPITRPNRRRIIPFTAARASRKVEVRFTLSTCSQSSSLSCTKRLSLVMPAFATRMSSWPSACSAFGTSASTASLSARSHGSTAAPPSSEASASSTSRRVPDTATLAPWACSARAIAPPMPPVAPVTSAFLPVRLNMEGTYPVFRSFIKRFRDGLHRTTQRRQVFANDIPDHLVRNRIIVVAQYIADPGDTAPVDLRPQVLFLVGDASRRLGTRRRSRSSFAPAHARYFRECHGWQVRPYVPSEHAYGGLF